MKKKLTLLVLVILIALVTATPVLAKWGPQPVTIAGTITAIDIITDIDGDTIGTITVLASNDRFAGQTLTVQVTDSTSFFMVTTGGHIPITFDEILVNASTNIKSTFVDDVYIASQVTVDVKLYCQ